MEAMASGRMDSDAYQAELNRLETEISLSFEESGKILSSAIENARTFDGRSQEQAAEINELMDSAQLTLGLALMRLFEGIPEQVVIYHHGDAEKPEITGPTGQTA